MLSALANRTATCLTAPPSRSRGRGRELPHSPRYVRLPQKCGWSEVAPYPRTSRTPWQARGRISDRCIPRSIPSRASPRGRLWHDRRRTQARGRRGLAQWLLWSHRCSKRLRVPALLSRHPLLAADVPQPHAVSPRPAVPQAKRGRRGLGQQGRGYAQAFVPALNALPLSHWSVLRFLQGPALGGVPSPRPLEQVRRRGLGGAPTPASFRQPQGLACYPRRLMRSKRSTPWPILQAPPTVAPRPAG